MDFPVTDTTLADFNHFLVLLICPYSDLSKIYNVSTKLVDRARGKSTFKALEKMVVTLPTKNKEFNAIKY